MKRHYFIFSSIAVFGFFVVAFFVSASSPFDIEFPIPELENCADKAACRVYCDDFAHKDACFAFAKKHGLTNERSEQAQKLPQVGPGGCHGEEECHSYCEDSAHLDECVSFGEQHGFISKKEAEDARKFAGQTGPGGCRGASECRAYCGDPGHQKECLQFARRKGLISEQNAKVAEEVTERGGPGGCRGAQECRSYCEDSAHLEECLSFGEANGTISKEEAVRIKKSGIVSGPGGCKGQEQCRQFCEDPAHQTVCIEWAVENGFMTKEEAERAQKFVGKTGPGGCRGEQCRDFCEKSENAEVCLEHAEREGLMPPQEIARAKKFLKASAAGGPGGCQGVQCRDFCNDPAHQDECFDFAKKQGLIEPEQEKQFEAGKKIREKVQQSGGPGGCKSDDECRTYCTDPAHAEECVAFGAAHAGLPEAEVRKMLKEFTEKRFDAQGAHGDFRPTEDFRRFEEDARRRFEEFKMLEEQFRGKDFPGGGFPGGQGSGDEGHRFGSGQGEGRFPGEFVGPGGCLSPVECIRYCTEHKGECFGQSGEQGGRMDNTKEECCPRPGEQSFSRPTLRHDLLQEVKHEELPTGFEQLPEEQKREFFKQKFFEEHGGFSSGENGFPGRPGEFPGRGQEGFPGRPNGFPGRPGEFPGGFQGMPREGEGFNQPQRNMMPGGFSQEGSGKPGEGFGNIPSGGFRPIPGTNGIFSPLQRPPQGFQGGNFSPQERFRPQGEPFRSPEGGFHPPEGGFRPQEGGFRSPEEGFRPPEGGFRPQEGSFQQPQGDFHPQENFSQPPTGSFSPPPFSGSFEQTSPPPVQPPPPPPSSFEQSSPPPPPPPPSGFISEGRGFFAKILDFFF